LDVVVTADPQCLAHRITYAPGWKPSNQSDVKNTDLSTRLDEPATTHKVVWE
jgi:ribonuclease HI